MKKKNLIMGDSITINNSPIGAVGRGAVNYGNITTVVEQYDFKILLEEIRKLKEEIRSIPQSDDQIIALSEVIQAESAVINQDGTKMAIHLRKLGPWVFNLIRDIGVNVIAGIITK